MLKITQRTIKDVTARSLAEFPHEACGLLVGIGETIFEARSTINVASEKSNRYSIDPFEMIRIEEEVNKLGLDLLGTYHSHPDNSKTLSSIDLASALPNWLYLLISTDGDQTSISLWKLSNGRFEEQQYEIVSNSGL